MTAAVLALNVIIAPDLPAMYQVGLVAVYAIAMVTGFPYAKLVPGAAAAAVAVSCCRRCAR